jgi:hypothetical protein
MICQVRIQRIIVPIEHRPCTYYMFAFAYWFVTVLYLIEILPVRALGGLKVTALYLGVQIQFNWPP